MSILKNLRKRRTAAQKEIRAAEARARQEVKERAKTQARREKLLVNFEKNLVKEEQKALQKKRKHEERLAKQEYEKIKAGRFNAQRVNRWIGAARVALPVLLPLIYRAITAGREQLVNARAQRVGVSADDIAQYSGHGATHKARLEGLRSSLDSADVAQTFRYDAEERIDTLITAIDNAEYMSPEQRRRSLDAISRDIDVLAKDIDFQTRN